MSRRLARSEEGSVLVMALVFLLVLSVAIAAVIGFASTGARTSVAVRSQRMDVYSADGAIEAQIKKLEASNGDCSTALTSFSLNGRSVTLTCSAFGSGDGTVNPNNRPVRAILTLGTAASPSGIDFNHEQHVGGGVFSHSDINIRSDITQVKSGDVYARTGCTPSPASITVQTGFVKNCNFTGTPDPSADDPGYAPTVTSIPATSPTYTTPPTCPAQGVVRFRPGTYPTPNPLNAITGSGGCNKTIWFEPGVYYFNFPSGNSTWSIRKNGSSVMVAGEHTGWFVNESTNASPTIPGACKKGTATESPAGVQFIFGGESHIDMGGGTFEVCPTASFTEQQIAIWGTGGTGPQHGFAPPAGCVLSAACPLISTGSTNSELYVFGTVYTPAAFLDLQVPNGAKAALVGRGVITKYLKINLPTSNPVKTSIAVPEFTGTGFYPYNEVILTALIDGRPRLRAKVRFEQNVAEVKDWSVLR